LDYASAATQNGFFHIGTLLEAICIMLEIHFAFGTLMGLLLKTDLEGIKGELIPYKLKSPSIFFNRLQTPRFDVETNKVCGSMRGLRFFCRGYMIFCLFCSFLAHKIKNK
jgi:hypothetical protein